MLSILKRERKKAHPLLCSQRPYYIPILFSLHKKILCYQIEQKEFHRVEREFYSPDKAIRIKNFNLFKGRITRMQFACIFSQWRPMRNEFVSVVNALHPLYSLHTQQLSNHKGPITDYESQAHFFRPKHANAKTK